MSKIDEDLRDTAKLLAHSGLYGTAVMTFTQRVITMLREEGKFGQDLPLVDSGNNKEIGRVSIVIQFSPHNFETRVEEDVKKVERIYYDLFEEDEDVIAEKLGKVVQLSDKKQRELEDTQKRLDFIRAAVKSVQQELALLRRQRDELDTKNTELRAAIEKFGDIKELHIQIDLLKNSAQGVEILREKYAKLLGKLELERAVYNDLSEQYFEIEERVKHKKQLEGEIQAMKKAADEQKFHLTRCDDMMPAIAGMKETLASQESIIRNLQNMVQENLKKRDKFKQKEIDIHLNRYKHERSVLAEKHKQLKIILDQNGGSLPYDLYQKYMAENVTVEEDKEEIARLQEKGDMLLREMQQLTEELDDMTLRDEMDRRAEMNMSDPTVWREERLNYLSRIEHQESKAAVLERQIAVSTSENARTIADLKQKLLQLDSCLLYTSPSPRDS
eukprot:TRINITY_DN11849_c0_g1_i3.p1 TRINITY_DN11849_c0_g1~~TRINITY_DN11849_c0_g1_i3.p1  ORF type:complete len:444 (-),score=104.62 TRINITY_DN11849_c0_g1_i3:41-1372(-)